MLRPIFPRIIRLILNPGNKSIPRELTQRVVSNTKTIIAKDESCHPLNHLMKTRFMVKGDAENPLRIDEPFYFIDHLFAEYHMSNYPDPPKVDPA
jgi:hypothetical protein